MVHVIPHPFIVFCVGTIILIVIAARWEAGSLRDLMVHPLGGNDHWSTRDSAVKEEVVTKSACPAPLLSNRLIGRLDRVGLRRFGRHTASLGFSGCCLAVARGGQFLLELRLFVGRHRRLFLLRR